MEQNTYVLILFQRTHASKMWCDDKNQYQDTTNLQASCSNHFETQQYQFTLKTDVRGSKLQITCRGCQMVKYLHPTKSLKLTTKTTKGLLCPYVS